MLTELPVKDARGTSKIDTNFVKIHVTEVQYDMYTWSRDNCCFPAFF